MSRLSSTTLFAHIRRTRRLAWLMVFSVLSTILLSSACGVHQISHALAATEHHEAPLEKLAPLFEQESAHCGHGGAMHLPLAPHLALSATTLSVPQSPVSLLIQRVPSRPRESPFRPPSLS